MASEVIRQIEKVATGKKVAFVSGNFNIVHPGHLRLLKFAKENGDFLVVGVNGQENENIIMHSQLRLEGIKAIEFVDFAFILNETPAEFIKLLKPNIVIKGKEHETLVNEELEIVRSYGGKLLFGSGSQSFSSADLISNEISNIKFSTIRKPLDFLERHKFSLKELKKAVKDFSNLKVGIIGDVIVDEYITCKPLGMSREDPTLVVSPQQNKKFIGGAGIVACHAKSLGAAVKFFSISGDDNTRLFVEEQLKQIGVDYTLLVDDSRPTTLKQRIRAGEKTLLRLNHLREHDISSDLIQKLHEPLRDAIKELDLLIFSDFNYGCLPQELVDLTIEACNANGVMAFGDSQSSSQVGDVSRFKNLEFITPTEWEARLAMRDFKSGLVVLTESLRKKANAKNVIVTMGSEGLLVHASAATDDKWLTDKLSAFNTVAKDPAGAGDSILTVASMARALGLSIWASSYLASIAAACQVSRIGNIPLKQSDLIDEIDKSN